MQEKIQAKLKCIKKERQLNHQNKQEFIHQCGILRRKASNVNGVEMEEDRDNQIKFEKLDQLINQTPQVVIKGIESDDPKESVLKIEMVKIES